MDKNIVITIGRQAGSKGHIIADRLAKKMGINCYDKELLSKAAENSGMAEQVFHTHDEKHTSSFLYNIAMDTYGGGFATGPIEMPITQKIFMAQFDTIQKLASEESCVIVGRCADYALGDKPNVLKVFIYADEEPKIRHIMETQNVNAEKAKDIMIKKDKERANYYNHYSNKKWGEAKSYDLSIDSGLLGIDGTVDLIIKATEIMKENMEKTSND